jgi:ATP-binding cassette subfamily F protein 3
MTNTEIRNICATFLFRGDDVFKTIDSLSGGEKGRVVLIKLLLNKANFLVLDEPTNHLDIQSKEILEDALLDFPGTILFISHDRYFINKIATKIVDMNAHGATTYIGDYDYFMAHKKEEKAAVEKKVNKDYLETKTQRSMDRKIKNKIKKVEEQISLLEEEINNLEQLQTTDEVINDYEKYNEITAQIEEKNNQLEEKMEEWEALNE